MLIGLAGEAGSGKDAAGTILKHWHGFTLLALAYPIKEMICGLLRVSMDMWDDRVWRETVIPLYKKSPRQLAQTIGTEWGRLCVHEDMWMDRLLAESKALGPTRLAITDVRFDNEALRIQSFGGHIIKVIRPGAGLGVTHPSERGLQNTPNIYEITNDGTLDDLAASVQTVLDDIEFST